MLFDQTKITCARQVLLWIFNKLKKRKAKTLIGCYDVFGLQSRTYYMQIIKVTDSKNQFRNIVLSVMF
jgi:hypothetical protein